jgi:hypothetical protein
VLAAPVLQGSLVLAAHAVVQRPDEQPDVSLDRIAQEVLSARVHGLAPMCSCALDVLTAQEGLEELQPDQLEALIELEAALAAHPEPPV